MGSEEVVERHIRVYERDWRAFKIWIAKEGYSSEKEAFHNLSEVLRNQPPAKMRIE